MLSRDFVFCVEVQVYLTKVNLLVSVSMTSRAMEALSQSVIVAIKYFYQYPN